MHGTHLVNHIKHSELNSDNTLHVVSTIFNPVRFHSRYRLFRRFAQEMENTPNVKFYIVEIAYGDRKFEVTEAGNPRHLQLRTNQEIWLKENALNLAVRHLLPPDWRYVSWLDGDIHFRNKSWALSAIHELNHYPVVQPWSHCVDLGPRGEVMQTFTSFGCVHRGGHKKQTHPAQPYKYAHSGFGWCATRYFWENVGGLMDFPILGSADHHMAWAMIGDVKSSVHGKMHENFKRLAHEWEKRACRVTHGDDVGFVPGTIEHYFHGSKPNRKYRERWQIFIDHCFDPVTDLIKDAQGLWRIIGKNKLVADIRSYFRGRNEDSTEA